MTTLGDILGAARRSASGFQAWLALSDPELASRVAEAARETGQSPTGYVRSAIADFSRFASEEDWATLVSTMRDSGDPGTDCLHAMVDWRLTAKGCGAHSHAAGERHHAYGHAHERGHEHGHEGSGR
jgi:hypothetical protein